MSCMLIAKFAKLLDFEPIGMSLLVLGNGVIASLTISTFQSNYFAHRILRQKNFSRKVFMAEIL
jgi:hypothetical protein